MIQKVTALVTRSVKPNLELLVFRHPYAGFQIPAGTVAPGESPATAALREIREETGLTHVQIVDSLGFEDEILPNNQGVIIPPATIYARPDPTSFDWINITSGIQVQVNRIANHFTQITFIENDQEPDPNYVSLQITGWIITEKLACKRRRHFFHFEFIGDSPQQWTNYADHHNFEPFWAPLNNLPQIISPQDEWLKYLKVIEP
jgi:8-oxo-dGTP pyrophosphatase MutT (NUDIX family)